MHETLAADAFALMAVYVLWKLMLRQVVGCAADTRGWGIETYVSAMVHQIATTLVTLHLLTVHFSVLSSWLGTTWVDARVPGLRLERGFFLMQAAEMLTDAMMHYHYPGFKTTYLLHHAFTLLAAAAAVFAHIPVGGCICFGAAMELGGLSLNVVSLWPSLTRSTHVPLELYTARVVVFVGSRVVAAAVMARTTQLSVTSSAGLQCYLAEALAWCIIFINFRWVITMVRSFSGRSVSKEAGRALDGDEHMKAFES